ncbi:MAG: AmmeMemoRadiSam system protein B [Treponema sp.]|nr:AmmeMemoRadiSam system protein B [Treponema sp.]
MQIRDYSLPAGWFPRDCASVSSFLSDFNGQKRIFGAAIAPHAGWYYSGRLSALAVAGLKPEAGTIVVIGGHLAGGREPLFAMEDAVKTPFGAMEIDTDLRNALMNDFGGSEDCYRDNTVEVLLPIVHHFFPKAKLLWLRLGAGIESFERGKIISKAAAKLNRTINVIASTDLTHYGANYGFSPKGGGKAALDWVREENDAAFIKAVESADSGEVLRRADEDSSSCSAGAVLGVMGFAEAQKLGKARLLEYATSADISIKEGEGIPDSFVGYAAFTFGG